MLTVDQLKEELAELLLEILTEVFGAEATEELHTPIRVAIMETPEIALFLRKELRKRGLEIPEPETFVVDWSDPKYQHPLTLHTTRHWVNTVAGNLLPMARALRAEIQQRRAMYRGDTVTPQMLDELQRRFPTTH